MKYTKEQIDMWVRMSQRAAGLSAELFNPKECVVLAVKPKHS